MAIFITGDTHSNAREEMSRFNTENFPRQKELTKEDYVIICGDFGFCWNKEESGNEKFWLNWLEDKPWTTLFIDGNHENHDRLDSLPVENWKGGKVHFLRPSVIHLMRGQIFTINGKTFATMGGAPSHDIQDGVFDPADYVNRDEMRAAIKALEKRKGGWQYALYRIKGESWWERETPSAAEYEEWLDNFEKHNASVDFILTHEAPASIVPFISIFPATEMSQILEDFRCAVDYKHWYFGHYHMDKYINDKETVVYEKLIQID